MATEKIIICNGCGVEISLTPYIHKNSYYCCQDCSEGYACQCGEYWEEDDDRHTGNIGHLGNNVFEG